MRRPTRAAGMFEERFFRKEFAMRTGTVLSVALGAVVLWMAAMPAISDGGLVFGGEPEYYPTDPGCACSSTEPGVCPNVLTGPGGGLLGCQGGLWSGAIWMTRKKTRNASSSESSVKMNPARTQIRPIRAIIP